MQYFISNIQWNDIADICIIAFIVYRLLLLIVDTRAVQLLRGLLVVGLVAVFANVFEFKALAWILSRMLQVMLIAIPILFQPELRRVLEELGRGHLWKVQKDDSKADALADEVTRALSYLAVNRIGAIIVMQRGTGLKDVWQSAVTLKASVSQELLISLFWPGNPLHDGAVIVDNDTVIAAGCYLPLTEETKLSRWYGTRHRAAIGVTEISDALALVVSEERGEVSLAVNGHLSKGLSEEQQQKLLIRYFRGPEKKASFFQKFFMDMKPDKKANKNKKDKNDEASKISTFEVYR